MELFNNVKRERLISIAENYINDILEDRGNSNVEDLASAFSNAGLTKSEFFAILDKYYLNDYTWAEETDTAEKVNTETGEDISVGDSDQAILETALTQIGIPYTWKQTNDTNGTWLDINVFDKGERTEITAAMIHFTKDRKFDGIY